MNLQSFCTLLGHLAWPATILAVVVMFRNELRRTLARLAVVRYHDLEANFEGQLRAAETAATATTASPPPPPAAPADPPAVEADPAAAVVAAWRALEDVLGGETLERIRGLGRLVAGGVATGIQPEQARRYVALAAELARRLEGLKSF